MSLSRPHHHVRILAHNEGWERSVRCTIVLKSIILTALALALFISPSHSAELKSIPLKSSVISKQASTGSDSPCVPPQITRTDKRDLIAPVSARPQRNAVSSPSMSMAMALSIALGLNSATGPVMKSSKAVGGGKAISGVSAQTRKMERDRTLTASAASARCTERISMR